MFNKRASTFTHASTETLSSLSSANTYSTTSPLSPNTPQSLPSKDYLSAFGDLQTAYGFGGNAPTPTFAMKSSKSKSSRSSKPPAPAQLPKSGDKPQQKDWEAAYGALSGSYGFGGGAPALPGKASWLPSKK